ncbi:hypothetical protein CN520_22935 [Bacillus cereus]|nr:hypothetical protein COM76_24090 [Bacillus cereus]PGA52258.1 hypothetical protein COL88_12845 [Bacillus thuringiensis]PDZ37546.1 hypothetical protein CON18_25685 [Bacillus cereus]PEC77468.1 hypothetical protein CON08_21570 [Bacillus cereus]PEE33379.1 hypothetical protein CON59_25945 [Bacillus cereus]
MEWFFLCFFELIYPALTGNKTPTSKFSESKEVRWVVGLIKVSLYSDFFRKIVQVRKKAYPLIFKHKM